MISGAYHMNYKGTKDKIYSCKNCKIEFLHKGGANKNNYCSKSCCAEFLRLEKEEKYYNAWIAGTLENLVKNPRSIIKKFVEKRDGRKCNSCGLIEWLGKPITLWCDHIDGNATNNQPSNFRLVCPNCDSQSATFGAKNYGKGRKSRGLPQYG
jgi:hypothetical protein